MRHLPSLAAATGLTITLFSPWRAEGQSTINQWKRWEQSITSTRNYAAGNPYRDLILRIEFTETATLRSHTQDAFWEAATNSFKVRGAFPGGGSWTWRVASCSGSTNGFNCATDTTWNPKSGIFFVNAVTTTGIRIYDRGHPIQLQSITANGTRYGQITYGDLVTPFYWAGDTAWAAPPREISGQTTNTWIPFLDDRKSKGFTAVLLAPAVAWTPKPDDPWPALPPAAGSSFNQAGSCTAPIPNDCSSPRPQYWQAFDQMVEQANARDMVVVIAGLIDPVRLASGNNYPNLANALDFARHLAARMAGNAVVFSPGFDDRIANKTFDGAQTVEQVMNSVGNALRTAVPRHLVTNHLGGGSTCTDYQKFQSSGWMTFYLFQSGHAFSANGTATQACPGRLSTETQESAALRRARQMPLQLNDYVNPSMPNVNGEGPYDKFPDTTDPLDNRYRVRQAGHVSSLSDAQGFTYGATNLGVWHNPATLFGIASSTDMQRLFIRFKDRAGLPERHSWILNQAAGDENKMVLASDGSTLVLAYLPGDASKTEIVISTTGLPTLGCGTDWTRKWSNPIDNLALANTTCTSGTGQITIKKPTCPLNNAPCDLVLELQRTGAAPLASGDQVNLEIWADLSPSDGTSAIMGRVSHPGLGTTPVDIVISPAGAVFQNSPRWARLQDGYLVVWHADGLDGSLYGVFAQKLDREGRLAGPRMQVNTYSEHDQMNPVTASDSSGNSMVVWSSYQQDGSFAGIYGRRFDRRGEPIGEEIAINSIVAGHQAKPQVAYNGAGNFVVAWTTGTSEGNTMGGIALRFFHQNGTPRSQEISIEHPTDSLLRLIDLQSTPTGEFSLRWSRKDPDGRSTGIFRQDFDSAGNPILGPQAVPEG